MDLKALGHKVSIPEQPSTNILETFQSPGVVEVTFTTHEFTSLCPVTGQPDFATIVITYTAKNLCVESKSLKLYLQSFRNEHLFMEALAKRLWLDLTEVLDPWFLQVEVKAVPRGGVAINAIVNGDIK
jgi:7-cyano-7-deazaguanine reductase